MNKPITSISEIIETLIRSFVGGPDHDDQEKRRRIFFALMMLVSILFMFTYGFHHLNKGDSTQGLFLLIVGVIQTISLISLRHLQNPIIIYRINAVLFGCWFLFIMIIGLGGGAGILWMFLFPPITFILLGKKEGLLLSIITFILSLFFLIDPHSTIGTYPYETGIKTRFPVIYGLFVIMGYIVRSVLRRYEERMEKEQLKLQSEIKVRIEAEEELKKYHDHLEELVQQRTSEMTVANERLMNEAEEHKKAKGALREAYDIINRSPAVAFLWKNEEGWPVEFVSDNVENLFGYTAEQFVSGKVDYASTVHPDDLERVAGEVLRFSEEEGRERFTHEPYRIVTKDGTVKWLDDRTYIRRDEKGKITHYQGIVEDITERRRTEDVLRASEANYRAIFDTANDAIFVHEIETGAILDVNRKMTEMYGYTAEEARQINVEAPSAGEPPYTQENAFRRMRKAAEGEPQLFEWKAKDKAGRVFWVEVNLKRVILGGKDRLLAMVRDITERKRAEAALRESEEKYRSLVSNATDAIFIVQDGFIKFPNPIVSALTGYSDEELATLPFTDLIHPEDRHMILDHYNRRLNGEEVPTTYSFRAINKKGEELWGQNNAVVISWEGKPAILCSVRDVTSQKRLEAQYLHAQKMEAVGTLAGGVAHDFNNLLQSILGFSEILLMDKGERDREYRSLQAINRAAQRGAELTRQLLTFGQKVESKLRPINLNLEVRQVEKLLKRTIPKMIEVELALAEDLQMINADAAQIGQVLMNLAINARDAMSEGGRLIIGTQNIILDEEFCRRHLGARPGEYVLLAISDTGCGMGREALEHLFEPFYTTKGVGKGTGLGLAMVYGIVKSHEGHIVCKSEVGKGTTFRIYWPVIEPAIGEERGEEKGKLEGGAETILVVDDEESIRELGKQILTKFGYKVLMASDGEEALEIYRRGRERIDLIILDLIMPGMGGKKCLEELLSINRDVKVVIATGYFPDEAMKGDLTTVVKGFIAKPYNMGEILQVIREVLHRKALEEDRGGNR